MGKYFRTRVIGVALASFSLLSLMAAPASAAANESRRIPFHTSAAALEHVKADRPDLYQRLLAYRSGQNVHVSKAEYRYLRTVNRTAIKRGTAAMEFSSQSRATKTADAQAKPASASVTITPSPSTAWKGFAKLLSDAGVLATPFLPWAVVLTVASIIINLIIAIAEAITSIGKEMAAIR